MPVRVTWELSVGSTAKWFTLCHNGLSAYKFILELMYYTKNSAQPPISGLSISEKLHRKRIKNRWQVI
jgi:hypothetical protein